MRQLFRSRFLFCALLLSITPRLLPAQHGDALAKAVTEIERIDAMRSALAGSFLQSGAPADQQAFNQVCKPVGQTLMQVAKANGWTMRQLSTKRRNPANTPDAEAAAQLKRFLRDPMLQSVSLKTTQDGKAGVRYLRRITVEQSCLACHGERDARPAFVVKNYPQDKAYAFKVGDLRGVYSVFMPSLAAEE